LVQGKAKDSADSASNEEPVEDKAKPKEEEKKKDEGPGKLKPTAPFKG
jgi:hypothetical protein